MFLIVFLYKYIKLSNKCYKKTKKNFTKKHVKDIRIFVKKKKKHSEKDSRQI